MGRKASHHERFTTRLNETRKHGEIDSTPFHTKAIRLKGIVLAGGSGTRLFPMTQVISKQLLPVYDKPMIYYPLSLLLLAKIREILIITNASEQGLFRALLGSGEQWGVKFTYEVQASPGGLAQAYLIARDFLAGEASCLVLGDNILYGHGLTEELQAGASLRKGARIFAYRVPDPQRYGVVEFSDDVRVLSLEEKPQQPKSNFAIPGVYFHDGRAPDFAAKLKPSPRGELEITDLNRIYFDAGELSVGVLGRGIAWFDTGTPSSLLQSANFVETIFERQGFKIACLEEIAYTTGLIDQESALAQADQYGKTEYGAYIREVVTSRDKALLEKIRPTNSPDSSRPIV
jgi:glucose-1-phosphate thymidylyltransferase